MKLSVYCVFLQIEHHFYLHLNQRIPRLTTQSKKTFTKHSEKKEDTLIKIFSPFLNLFYDVKDKSCYLFTKRHNFRQVQIQSICRRQNNLDSKVKIRVGKSRKHCGKRRKCWLPAFSHFPTRFSKDFLFRGVKSRDCVVKGYSRKKWYSLPAYTFNIMDQSVCCC